jgi:hypothetical protein
MIEHTIADAIKKIAKEFVKEVRLDYVCPHLFEKVCEENCWTFELVETYGNWEGNWWAIIKVDSTEINISGCMYYGTAELVNGKYL